MKKLIKALSALAIASMLTAAPLCLKAQAATLTPDDSSATMQPAALAIGGRAVQRNGIWYYQWPGVYFDTELQGDSAYLRLPAGKQHLQIRLDGQRIASLQPPLSAQYRLAGMGPGPHRLRIELVSEQQDGARGFGGVWLPAGGSATLPRPSPRRIEFIGDSYTVGYGNQSSTRLCSAEQIWASTDNGLATGPIVARHYQADYRIHAISGRGIVRNYAGMAADTLPQAYPYQLFDHNARDDGDAWQPHYLVLGLGTNDFSTALGANERWPDRAALQADFVSTYVAFIGTLRQRYPQAQLILWASGTPDSELRQANRAVLQQLRQHGESRVSLLELAPLSLDSCDWHPSQADHQLIARRLIEQIDAMPALWPTAAATEAGAR